MSYIERFILPQDFWKGAIMISTFASTDDGKTFYFLASIIAAYMNAHMFYDLRDMPEAERLAEIETLKSWMEELMH